MTDFENLNNEENNKPVENETVYSNFNYTFNPEEELTIGKLHNTKKEKKPLNLTITSFVLILICAMVVTSALTVLGIGVYDNHFAPGTSQGTNYKLTATTKPMTYKNIVNKVSDSVVSISTESLSTDFWAQNYVTKGAGSGVIIQSNGYIMTCNHVIDGASKITVTLKNKKSYKATLVGSDADNDLAILKINAVKLHPANYGNSSKLSVGDEVIAIGNPLGELSNTATTGIVSALNRNLTIQGETLNLLQTDASINPGNSGGALFDSEGNLVGIVVAKSSGSDVEGLGFAIPINHAAKLGKQLIQTGQKSDSQKIKTLEKLKGKAIIGVTVQELNDEQAKSVGFDKGGVFIGDVTSPYANAAGIKAGDRIAKVDGKEIKTIEDLTSVLKKHKPKDKVSFQGMRRGKSYTTKVELMAETN